jgi:hypothetical protein
VSDPQGIRSWWDLDELAGAAAAIAYGPYQNHGAYVGGVTPGGPAGGVAFDGTTGYISVPHAASLVMGSPDASDTWALWAMLKRGPIGANRTIVSKGGGAYGLRVNAAGRLEVLSNGNVIATSGSVLDANVHQVLAGRAGTQVFLYLDGANTGSATMSGDFSGASSYPLRIGALTDSGGVVRDFYNGTLYGLALISGYFAGATLGPVLLPRINASACIDVPAVLTTWRDLVDASNVSASLAVRLGHGREPLAGSGHTWDAPNNVPGGSSGTIAPDAMGRATIALPVAAAMNGRQVVPMRLVGHSSTLATTWDQYVRAQWALTRLSPNVALGDHVSELAAGPQLVQPATHAAAAFMRAATGPNAGDYMAGSSWALVPPATLPATAAYLAVQLQLVRRA